MRKCVKCAYYGDDGKILWTEEDNPVYDLDVLEERLQLLEGKISLLTQQINKRDKDIEDLVRILRLNC